MHETRSSSPGPDRKLAGDDRDGSREPSPAVLHEHMVRLRLLSSRLVQLQREGAIAFHASSIGAEAVIVGATLAARASDWIFPNTRGWGAAVVRGLPLAECMHHAFGTAKDRAKGHSAPDHPPARAHRVAPASGVPGAHLPQAVGFAWGARIRKTEDVVTIALFDEDVTTTGDFHNALNFAGVFKAPCVFVCLTDGRRRIADRAVAYGLAHAVIDGGDVAQVMEVVKSGVARASQGKGALLVEAVTSPLDPDSDTGDGTYGLTDPIVRFRAAHPSVADAAFEERTRDEIAAAMAFAAATPGPAPESMFEDVYAEVPKHLAKEATTWRR